MAETELPPLSPEAKEALRSGHEAYDKEDYKEAVKQYEIYLKERPEDSDVLVTTGFILGTFLENLEKGRILLEYILNKDPKHINALFNLGFIYLYNGSFTEAQSKLEETENLAPKGSIVILNDMLIFIYRVNKEFQKLEHKCIELKKTVLYVYSLRTSNNEKDINNIAINILNADTDTFFSTRITNNFQYRKELTDIYSKAMSIVQRLFVNISSNKLENHVAHYTKKWVAEQLLLNNSPMQLNTVAKANDPGEGKPLLTYLGIREDCISDEHQAFVASFIFNPDSLNQFRLYGKEENKEATGLSLVFNSNFFNQDISINKALFKSNFTEAPVDEIQTEIKEDTQNEHESLYRCIYLDPSTRQVISVGHKEDYTFYREQLHTGREINQTVKDEYKAYKKEIESTTDKVREELSELQEEINKLLFSITDEQEKKKVEQTICDLLIHLRYLVKHVAFKEEQECRIICVESLDKNERILEDINNERLYINYRTATDSVTDIYFAPKAEGKTAFGDRLRYHGLKIKCHQCEHPFST